MGLCAWGQVQHFLFPPPPDLAGAGRQPRKLLILIRDLAHFLGKTETKVQPYHSQARQFQIFYTSIICCRVKKGTLRIN